MMEKKKPARKKVESPFAGNLKEVLTARGLSMRAAAEIAGVAGSVVAGWLEGVLPHDVMAVNRLSKGLGVSFEWLLTGQGPKEQRESLRLEDLFEEHAAFDGIYKVSAKKLVLKKSKESGE